jgi:glycosyltransferase involved in cell wall biosynthesis
MLPRALRALSAPCYIPPGGMEFLCISPVPWESLRQRHQKLMRQLSCEHCVLYVEPPALLEQVAFRAWHRQALLRALHDPRRLRERLCVFTPWAPSLSSGPYLKHFSRALVRHQIERASERIGFKRPVIWTYFWAGLYLETIPDGPLAYDCVDEISLHLRFAGRRTRVGAEQREIALAKKAKWVFATSRALFERVRQLNPNSYLLPNAVDTGHFLPAFEGKLPCPQDLQGLRRPIVGFVGSLGPFPDYQLLAETARLLPHLSFAVVGPRAQGTDISPLMSVPNIHILGEKAHSEVPAYIQQFAVCLIPYLVNDMTRGVMSLKLFEYLAAGKPVVATPLPENKPFAEVVTIVSGPRELAAAIATAIAEDSTDKKLARLEAARQNTWERRCRTIIEILSR